MFVKVRAVPTVFKKMCHDGHVGGLAPRRRLSLPRGGAHFVHHTEMSALVPHDTVEVAHG